MQSSKKLMPGAYNPRSVWWLAFDLNTINPYFIHNRRQKTYQMFKFRYFTTTWNILAHISLKKVVTGITKGWKKKQEQFGKSFLWEQVSSVTRYKRASYREENRDSPTYKQKSKTMFLCEKLQRFWTSQHVENIMSPKDWENLEKSSDGKRLNISTDCLWQSDPHSSH